MVLTLSGYAQRTSKGQGFIDFGPTWPLGATVEYGRYTLSGYWFAGAQAVSHYGTLSNDDRLDFLPIRAEGGYEYRFLANRSRSVSLYCGGVLFAGSELMDPFGKLPENISVDLRATEFIMGAAPRVCAEIYFCPGAAVSAYCQLPWTFGSQMRSFTLEGGLSVRILL